MLMAMDMGNNTIVFIGKQVLLEGELRAARCQLLATYYLMHERAHKLDTN